ncbi:zinc-dependent alcohol dehydrogenase family protein [Comamonas endophytica]|uniref:NAD(P)-dependent alcohol dehydrogenase n=1 Tax=Comamonas endophytica TaxID=2949090 RepID=A0ABY6GF45_9BURK|nr:MULTISPECIES: NAD(P)-dependent alcohol dehydrogenase [unclassified Acidovorax]MCD2514272.1 NAD(P)-dependent alcohol dehydrogenase [Acidovorax sp. D4N7]UYG53523.1 NAD(P)-dependent alcohol dehydrogenase [Acidovorax sp. 5MLIR]
MKAIQLTAPGGLDRLQITTLADAAAPQAHEIQVRIHASSLNYHDLMVASREGATAPGRIPMADGAGVVTAVGAGVTEFAVGDHVVSCFFPQWQSGRYAPSSFDLVPGDGCDGFAREMVTMPATAFTHAPRGYSHEEAATLTTAGLTAWRALVVDGQLQAGDTVLVLGTGGVSLFALQMAKSMGARVVATTSSAEKAQRLKDLGADAVINYRETPEWGDAVLAATGGRGADIVVEVGGPGTLAQSIRACAVGGHIALIGVLTGFSGSIPTAELMSKQQTLQGLIVGSREQQQDMVRALEQFSWKPVIDSCYPLEQLAAAFRHQQSGAHIGKICLSCA